jgi:pimeloyl-ACP methyl ester carboxylesterase
VPDAQQDVADLAVLCRSLQLTAVAVLGMSQGTRSALGFASQAPATVRALVLDGAPDLQAGAAQGDIPLAHFQDVLRTQGIAALRSEWRAQGAMQLRTADRLMHALLKDMLKRYDGRDLRDGAAAGTPTAQVNLANITVPVLVLNGEFDLATRSTAADYLCRQLPQAERHLISWAGHLPNLDNPDDYADLCRSFLSRQLRGSTWR